MFHFQPYAVGRGSLVGPPVPVAWFAGWTESILVDHLADDERTKPNGGHGVGTQQDEPLP